MRKDSVNKNEEPRFDWVVGIKPVPADWTEEQDIEACVAMIELPGGDLGHKDYYPLVLEAIDNEVRFLDSDFDEAIGVIPLERIPHSSWRALSGKAKVEVYRSLARRHGDPDDRCRLERALDRCIDVLKIKDALLRKYIAKPSSVWLIELAQLMDQLVSAWSDIDQMCGTASASKNRK